MNDKYKTIIPAFRTRYIYNGKLYAKISNDVIVITQYDNFTRSYFYKILEEYLYDHKENQEKFIQNLNMVKKQHDEEVLFLLNIDDLVLGMEKTQTIIKRENMWCDYKNRISRKIILKTLLMVGVITITINLLEFKLLENAITDNFIRALGVTNKCFTILVIGIWYYEKQKSRILTQEERVKNEMAAKVYHNFIVVGILIYFYYIVRSRGI